MIAMSPIPTETLTIRGRRIKIQGVGTNMNPRSFRVATMKVRNPGIRN
jgi:hypothetical protein